MKWAINQFRIPTPAQSDPYNLVFQVEEWSPFATINSIQAVQSMNAGFAVDDWRPSPFITGNDFFTNQPIGNIWTGSIVDGAVFSVDGWLYRIGTTSHC